MNQLGFPIISYAVFLPVAVAVIILLFLRRADRHVAKYIATYGLLIDFVLSLVMLGAFDTRTAEFQFVENFSWIEGLGISYHVGVDGISLLMILLTTFLGLLAALSSWTAITEREKEYYVFLLLLQTGMLGVFVALDFFLFYVFWEAMLIPMYFLIGIWGGPRRIYATIKFLIYTLTGSLVMLVGILALYFLNYQETGRLSFDLMDYYRLHVPPDIQFWIFLAFFLSFAIKVPLFPFHTWLPDAHVEAPTAGSVILAGVLLKMGAYGFLRFSLPILPEATISMVPFMALLALIGIVYGALVAWAQQDIKKLVAYSSVSHLGLVILGIFALNRQGIEGGILQMVNHGLSTGALFLLVGMIYERRHTRDITQFGGLSSVLPVFAAFFMIIMLSSIGVPGLNGFVGEFLVLLGAFKMNYVYSLVAVLGIVLGAVYMLWVYEKTMFGPVSIKENASLHDLSLREMATLVPIAALVFLIGIYPSAFLGLIHTSVDNLVARVETAQPSGAALSNASNGLGPNATTSVVAGFMPALSRLYPLPSQESRFYGTPPPNPLPVNGEGESRGWITPLRLRGGAGVGLFHGDGPGADSSRG